MMAERGIRVAVAGGGVAGASCAIALARIGAEVTVYEAYRDPAGPVGSFVSLAVNGLRAPDVLGVLAPVQAAGFDVERHRMWSGRGKLLGDVPRGRRSGDSLHSVTLMRGDLAAVTAADLAAVFRAEARAVAILDAAQQVHAAIVHHVLAPVPRRHTADTVLVGDAAHPAAPAGELARTAASSNEAKTAGPVAARLRDMIMPVMVRRFCERATAWLYDYDPGQLPARRTTTGAA